MPTSVYTLPVYTTAIIAEQLHSTKTNGSIMWYYILHDKLFSASMTIFSMLLSIFVDSRVICFSYIPFIACEL